tara:strand:+ start:2838 stop:3950 length:1113 start_codon:yes stop_codon:yes gene_type:complete
MYLTKEEEATLEGEKGEGYQKAMKLIVALGDISDAEKLIPVCSSQVSGVSYKTIGDAGLDFLRELAATGVKARIDATLNPMGADPFQWHELGFSEEFMKKQMEIIESYNKLGIRPSCTCTPYLADNIPLKENSVSWAESSAVVFANSVIGCKTNRESGISALSSALIGKTPLHGLHLNENRIGTFNVKIDTELKSDTDYSALGYYIGKHYDGVPVFNNLDPKLEYLKALSAGLGVGQINMFHITSEGEKLEKISFGKQELNETYESLNTTEDVDIVCVGCPHCSIREIYDLIKLKPEKNVWAFTSRHNCNLIKESLGKNIKLISDTCMVVSPLEELDVTSIGVTSAKAAFYSSNLSKLGVKFDSIENLIK